MNTIKTIILVLVVAALTMFSVLNNNFVPVSMGFQDFNVWLPLLVLLSFALGFIPLWLWLATDRMILRRKLAKVETALAKTESDLAQARVELLRPPSQQAAAQSAGQASEPQKTPSQPVSPPVVPHPTPPGA